MLCLPALHTVCSRLWATASCSAGYTHIAYHATKAATKLPRKRTKKVAEPPKVQALGIVSEELCDDILKQLAPSLEKHRGCDIVDIFPGDGLWSRRLHQVLQPRSHHIVEQIGSKYEKIWKSRIEEHGTTYKLTATTRLEDIYNFGTWGKLMDQILPPPLAIPKLTLPSENINNSVLVLLNSSRVVKKSSINKLSGGRSPSEPFLFYMLENLRYKSGLQSAGAVRLLLWTSQNDKYNILPRNITHRSKVDLDSQESYLTQEIAGDAEYSAATQRAPVYDVESAYSTALRMKQNGVELPVHRRSKLHQHMLDSIAAIDDTGEVPELVRDVKELRKLEVALYNGDFPRYGVHQPGEDKRYTKYSAQYNRIVELREKLNVLTDHRSKYSDSESYMSVVTAQRNLFEYERELRSKYPEGEHLVLRTEEEKAMMKRLEDILEEAWSQASGRESRRRQAIRTLTDNEEALRTTPPLLDWDRRTTEPLDCFDHEFDPPKALVLLDLQPLSDGPMIKHGRSVTRTAFFTLLRFYLNETVADGLNVLAHGAADALIPQCPSLTDPARGGHMHLEHVTIRLLTHEHIKELEEAWNQWPFKVPEEVLQARVRAASDYQD